MASLFWIGVGIIVTVWAILAWVFLPPAMRAPRRDSERGCRKCGNQFASFSKPHVEHVPGVIGIQPTDRLRFTCLRCGYVWTEACYG